MNPTTLYVGTREAVMAEVGTPGYYPGKYLTQPDGDAQWDAEGAATKAEVKAIIAQWRSVNPTIEVIWL